MKVTTCVYACVCMYKHVCEGQRTTSGYSSGGFYLYFETGSLPGQELTKQARVDGQ